jgi:glycosyltransferase involved in cell wall biosynthesis
MIDPRQPDYSSTPIAASRAKFSYGPAGDASSPAVTVVTPFYNTGEVFRETARCILGQSLQNFEWIIVDDGTTNPVAAAMLNEYRHSDPRIRVIDLPKNVGPGEARNAGVRAARAPYFFQLDADDLIEPTTLEMCAWYLATHPDAAFVKGWTVGFSHNPHLWTRGFHEGPAFLHENLSTITAMVRRDVFLDAGGYDPSILGGMEDWDFWVRLASRGKWGATIPQYLDWYRRRPNHADVWEDWDGAERQRKFTQRLRERYPQLTDSTFPSVPHRASFPFEDISPNLPVANPLAKGEKRLLMIVPWLTMGGADKYNLRMIEQLSARGWQVTVASTLEGDQVWLPEFTKRTPDVFVMPHFLPLADRPRFLRSLIESRRPDAVMITNSELGYLVLPYLRAHCPDVAYVDYCHMEENYWKNGGYPRYAARCQEQLELNIVSSRHLKSWMVDRGADASRIEICTTNEDGEEWKPDPQARVSVRAELSIEPQTPVLLYAGRLCDQKQPRVFAGTMLELHKRGCNFVTIIAGDGPDRAMLEEFSQRHGLSHHLRFMGAVPNTRMKLLAAASDMFFLPSLWEGVSLAIFEAMAAGLAIIGADVGGQRELVTPDCGVLIPRSNHAEEIRRYADALHPFIVDPSHARQIGEAGRRRILDHYRLDHMGERLDSLLQQAIDLRRTQPRPAVPVGVATEIAARGVEYLRVHEVADHLWADRERLRMAVGGAGPGPASVTADDSCAELELARIESSRLYGVIRLLKANPFYSVTARLRWGEGWNRHDSASPAPQRLARLKASRSYRFIQAIKSTSLYRLYALRKYGSIPEADGLSHLQSVSADPTRANTTTRTP